MSITKSLELNKKELLMLIKDMINCGLKEVEVYHSSHLESEFNQYLNIVNKYGLLASGGSDYLKLDIEVGTGKKWQ